MIIITLQCLYVFSGLNNYSGRFFMKVLTEYLNEDSSFKLFVF